MSNIKSYQLTHIDEITFEQPAAEQDLCLSLDETFCGSDRTF